jgi:hypothetical protein
MHLKSDKKPKKPDVWVTEIKVKDENVSVALIKLVRLVRKYENLS